MEEPAAYGKLGLANLLELREECLREFHFVDCYRSIKQRYSLQIPVHFSCMYSFFHVFFRPYYFVTLYLTE